MGNLAITAANVLPSANNQGIARGTAGVAITAGQVLYLDNSTPTRLLQLAGANISVSGTPITPVGIAVNSAAAGQPVDYVASDPLFVPGANFPQFGTGTSNTYVLSQTPGAMCLPGDLAPGSQPVIMLLPNGTNTAVLQIVPAAAVLG